jgi:sulfatase maturation enzyme AslB (radical SAM superfamily)
MNHMRQTMLDGQESITSCQPCYNDEISTGKSMRTGALSDYKFFNSTHHRQLLDHYKFKDIEFPNRLELHLGNLCNLKCLTCNPRDSSAFLAENRTLGISNHNQKDYQLSDDNIEQILNSAKSQDIKILDLRGGESMLMPSIKKILLSWPDSQASGITLRIQTNCTVIDEQWKIIFKKFGKLEIMMSIDAHGLDNEYIRFPSLWSDIVQNIDVLTKLDNATSYINCTLSNLNFLVLPKLLDWCKEKNIYFHWSPLRTPTYFHFTNMPEELFKLGQQRLMNYPEVKSVMSQNYNDESWNNFCNMISLRDNYRKNSIFDVIPEFKTYWKTT